MNIAVGHNIMPIYFFSFISFEWHVPIRVMKEGEPIKIATLDKKGQGKEYLIEYTCTIVNICLSITL